MLMFPNFKNCALKLYFGQLLVYGPQQQHFKGFQCVKKLRKLTCILSNMRRK